MKNKFDSTFENEQETYWDNLKIHSLNFSLDPEASNCHPYTYADTQSTRMKQRFAQQETLGHINIYYLIAIIYLIKILR